MGIICMLLELTCLLCMLQGALSTVLKKLQKTKVRDTDQKLLRFTGILPQFLPCLLCTAATISLGYSMH